jgi:hypothetical protein
MTTNAGARDGRFPDVSATPAERRAEPGRSSDLHPWFATADAWIAFEPLSFETTERVVDVHRRAAREAASEERDPELTEPAAPGWLKTVLTAFGARPCRADPPRSKEPPSTPSRFVLQMGNVVVVPGDGLKRSTESRQRLFATPEIEHSPTTSPRATSTPRRVTS